MSSGIEDASTVELVTANCDDKSEEKPEQELVNLTVLDDSEISKVNDTIEAIVDKSAIKDSPEKKCPTIEHDSLILTADDEIFSVVSNDKESPQKKPSSDRKTKREPSVDDDEDDEKKSKVCGDETSPKNLTRTLWVSNISRDSKASDLKQYFVKVGKVNTAKIVTDGKNFYGYLSFETREDAERCLRKLDGSTFEAKKLKLSFARPNHDSSSSNEITEKRRKSSIEHKSKKKSDNYDPLTTRFKTKSRSPINRVKQLERDYLREKREAERLKRRIQEQEELNRLERRRQRQREDEQREMEWKLQMQRKQLQIEREMFEKERKDLMKLDEVRRKIEEERLEIMKEKERVKDALRNARKSESKKRVETEKAEEKKRVKSKICDASRNKSKSMERYGGRHRKDSKERMDFPRTAPPPPKLSEIVIKNKINRSYEECNKKNERNYRKIETIHRDRRQDLQGKRDQFLSRNQQGRDGGGFNQAIFKPTFISKPWEITDSNGRYEENYQGYSGGYYYHATPSADDYSRYQQYNMHLDRKY